MRRRTQPRKVKSKRSPEVCVVGALLVIDATPIRNKARREYQKALDDLSRARAELEFYQQSDFPAYERWYHHTFGDLLSELRQLIVRRSQQETLLKQVSFYAFVEGISHAQAYRVIMADRRESEAGKANPHSQKDRRKDARDGQNLDPDEEDFFGKADNDAGPDETFEFETKASERESNAKVSLRSRLKDLYRALVRRLHPDTQKEVSSQKLEWWHQTQEAYEAEDEEQMEMILTLCDLADGNDCVGAPISTLQAITKQLQRSLRGIKRELKESRRNPAWQFTARNDLASLARSTRTELTSHLEELRLQVLDIDKTFALWEKKRGPSRRRRPQSFSPDFF